MPTLRGLIASLGAGVSLAAAGAFALLAVSVVILFQGFPGLGLEAQGGTLELSVPRSEPAEPEEDGPVLLADAPDEDAAEAVAAGDPPALADEPAPVADGPVRVPDDNRVPDTDDGFSPGDPGGGPTPGGGLTPTPDPDGGSLISLDTDEPVSGLTGLTGGVLRTTGETLAPVTDTLLPGSGKAVESLTDDLGDTVQSTGDALGATLGLLLVGR